MFESTDDYFSKTLYVESEIGYYLCQCSLCSKALYVKFRVGYLLQTEMLSTLSQNLLSAATNGSELTKMKKSIPDMSLP